MSYVAENGISHQSGFHQNSKIQEQEKKTVVEKRPVMI